MKRKQWISVATVVTVAVSLLISLLANWLADVLQRVADARGYGWLLSAASIAGLGISALVLFLSSLPGRRRREPPPIWRVAERAWDAALADRPTLPPATKELPS